MTVRIYGNEPYKIAVLHGGPGAAGYMATVAIEISKTCGVLEPWQSGLSVQEQIDELKNQIKNYAPIILIGHSWGAMLTLLFAAQNQNMVKKLILVGCGTFTKEDSQKVDSIRNERFSDAQKLKLKELMGKIDKAEKEEQNKMMREFGNLFDATDKYEPTLNDAELSNLDWNVFAKVSADFEKLHGKENYIKSEFAKIKIPVTLIQGDYDPHPIKEVRGFLKSCIPQIKLYELRKCGHYPWIEKYAKDEFYQILNRELVLA